MSSPQWPQDTEGHKEINGFRVLGDFVLLW